MMGAIHGYPNLSTISRTLAMSFGFVKQHPPAKECSRGMIFLPSLHWKSQNALLTNPSKNNADCP